MKQLPDKNSCSLGGRLTKTHGFTGELILRSAQPLPESIEKTEFVCIDINAGLVPFFVLSARIIDETSAIIKLEDVVNVEQAAKLTGYDVYLEDISTSKKTYSPTSDYTGYLITDKTHGEIGAVKYFLDIPGNPLLQTDYKGNELLIPFNDTVVLKINNRKKIIRVKLPEGLIGFA